MQGAKTFLGSKVITTSFGYIPSVDALLKNQKQVTGSTMLRALHMHTDTHGVVMKIRAICKISEGVKVEMSEGHFLGLLVCLIFVCLGLLCWLFLFVGFLFLFFF